MMNDPETFVINLDDRTDRWDAIQKLCSGAGLTPRRISAVRATPGWIGCTYSHMKCMQIAKEEQLPWVLILEDDATFTPASFNRFRMLLPFLWENRGRWERFNGGPTLSDEAVLQVLCKSPPLVYARGYTSHFNLIHSAAYDAILTWQLTRHNVIDEWFIELETKPGISFNSIATYPHISVQAGGVSDLVGEVVQYAEYFAYSEERILERLEIGNE